MSRVSGRMPYAWLHHRLLAAVVCAGCLVTAAPLLAQPGGVTATLRGTVEDASDAVIPGATVTVANLATTDVRTTVTDERGGFTFTGVFPATYELSVELTGFKTYRQPDITLGPNDTVGVRVRLEVGSRAETVVVTSSGDILPTETGAREGRLTARQIDDLAVIGRSPLELLRILPGVVAPDPTVLESVGFGRGANATQAYSVNGIRTSHNTFSIDGSNVIILGCNCGTMITLNNDMVQEVKVQSSNFDAEYGTGGMNVSAVTKGGSSQLHGTGYWYGRDHRLAANDRSRSILGIPKLTSGFFYPGGNVGGPVVLPVFHTRAVATSCSSGLASRRSARTWTRAAA